ncbi:DUF969 domain-containing protein [Kutzneria viridogrisea]|uniref:Membrane protein n=2 Tax=Kutzneria TaxID=43356 RepID=A0ABR6BNU4_9PSEU|nr:DUF969 domain-containing protein [Kutzneria albida]AHH96216.1 protein of hypothetical function DUF969 [Kutzneria albida DSM 43870]MBA8928571.1 putative membrane protein [Kutzneria viridogrisea]
MLVLLGVALVVVGFALRLNPLLVVTASGIVTAVLGGVTPSQILDAFGNGFAGSRSVTIYVVTLPAIGLLDRFGLQQQATRLIGKLRVLTTGRLLATYLLIRQGTAALGLTGICGPAQTLRPLIAPMALGAATRRHGELSDPAIERVKAYSASADTVGLFFGEDIFLAVGSILLITGFVDTTYHLKLDALQIALWAIPTAVCALVIHSARLLWLDRRLAKELAR